jgi:hypothetical protein
MECGFDNGACCFPLIDDSECELCVCRDNNTRHPSKFAPDSEPPPPFKTLANGATLTFDQYGKH